MPSSSVSIAPVDASRAWAEAIVRSVAIAALSFASMSEPSCCGPPDCCVPADRCGHAIVSRRVPMPIVSMSSESANPGCFLLDMLRFLPCLCDDQVHDAVQGQDGGGASVPADRPGGISILSWQRLASDPRQ